MPALREKPVFYISLLCLSVLAAFFPLFLGRFYAVGDMRDVFIPLENFFRQEMLSGRLPIWHPGIAWGYPVLASAQIGFFYPLSLLLRPLPLPVFLSASLFLHFLSLAAGTYFLLRRLALSPAASALGAASFALGGFSLLHLTHLNIIFGASWLPWQFLWFHHLATRLPTPISPFRRQEFLRLISISAVLLATPFLAGQIQIPLLVTVVSSAWFLWLAWPHASKLSLMLTLALAAVLAFLLASAQLLPTLELLTLSSRAPSRGFTLETANQYSYPLYHLPALLLPRFFGNDHTYWGKRLQIEYGFYVGTVPLILAVLFLCRQRFRLLPRHAKFFYLLLPLTFLLALGNQSPFRLLGFEPSLWFFSAPSRWLLFTSFALSFLAASGYDLFTHTKISYRRLFLFFTVLLLGTLLIATVFLHSSFFYQILSGLSSKISRLYASAAQSSLSLTSPYTWLPVLALCIWLAVLKNKIAPPLLIYFSLFELVLLALTTTPTLPWPDILAAPATTSELPASVTSGQARLHTITSGGDTGAYFTDPSSRADSTIRQVQKEAFIPLLSAQYGLSGTSWPASLPLASQLSLQETINQSPAEGRLFNESLAAQANIGAVSMVDGKTRQLFTLSPSPRASLVSISGQEAAADYRALTPSSVRISFAAAEPSHLIIRDTYYPGWQATMDGAPLPLVRHSGHFIRALVPRGQHVILIQYWPKSLQVGLTLSSLTAVLVLVIIPSSIKRHPLP